MIVLPAPASSARRKRTRAEFEEVIVDRFELVRQRIDAGNRETEIRIELVSDAERVSLKPEPEQAGRRRRSSSSCPEP